MTESDSNHTPKSEVSSPKESREGYYPPDNFDPLAPRIGRRESEPHSLNVTLLHDVLETNFPQSRVLWDLTHYFRQDPDQIILRIDISWFQKIELPKSISSYDAKLYNHQVPDLAINILSKGTWRADIGENVDICRELRIANYVIFAPYHVASKRYKPPFLRAYCLDKNGEYRQKELRGVTISEKGVWDASAILSTENGLPFRFGIKRLPYLHADAEELYTLILIHSSRNEILPTTTEQEKARADQEKARADQEKARADQEKARADRLAEELEKMKTNL